ncbi:MAG: DUF2264 domain-containing protein [Chitinophagaceae bacterium]
MMQRRNFIGGLSLSAIATFITPKSWANDRGVHYPSDDTTDDRTFWYQLLFKIAYPVVSNLAAGTLKMNMMVEKSPSYDSRSLGVTYLEAVGRTYAGIAPWLALPDDDSPEGALRKKLRELAVHGLDSCFAPNSPDRLNFEKDQQPIVDAAYLAHSFLRAPDALWKPLQPDTKLAIVGAFKSLRDREPYNNNWLLFASITEAFLVSIGEVPDEKRLKQGVVKLNEWYKGDGWYGDGPNLAFDYYNSYVIHPMMVDTLAIMSQYGLATKAAYDLALKRMQRYGVGQERMISPEGTFPPIGRSLTYRTGSFQALSQLALMEQLPVDIKPAQVRSALTKVKRNMYAMKGIFDKQGWLQLGFCGHDPTIADKYTSTGSLYMATLSFLPLGLPASAPFWADPASDWTAKRAWNGDPFPKDYHVDY